MDKEEIKEITETPMDDREIKQYLPNVPVMVYSDLKNYSSLDELLPENKSYCILLYEWTKNNGHWVAVLKYDDNFEYFDPYGEGMDKPLEENGFHMNEKLGQYDRFLTNLLNGSKLKRVINHYDFQKENPDIATCGRHCIFRILNNMKNNLDLPEYTELMKKLKNKMKMNYDEIVSAFINEV